MKFSKYFMMAGAAFMLAACSSEEPIGQAPGSEVLDGAEVYASFRINMVSPDGTRAPMDVTDETGDADEYLIDNGKVLIFGVLNDDMNGKTDVNQLTLDERVKARFIVAADLENMGTATAGSGSIKDTYQDVKAKFAKGTFSSANYSAYLAVCILNCQDAASGITSFLPKQGESFADWGTREDMNSHISFPKDGKTYFKMTNAPVYISATNDHRVLEIVNPSLVFENESDLEGKDAAAKFTVQRLAAKITVKSKEPSKSFTVGTEGYKGTATLTAWATDNTRKTTFPVQNVWYDTELDEFNDFLLLNKSWLHSDSRCFWGYSKFYTQEYANDADGNKLLGEHFNRVTTNQVTTWSDEAAYIRENMVAYNKMAKGNTTRVVVKATYNLQGKTEGISFIKIDNVAKLYTTEEFCATVKEHYLDIKNEVLAEAEKDNGDNVVVSLSKTTGNAYTFGEFISIKDGDTTLTYNEKDADKGYTVINRVAGRMGVYDVDAEEVFLYQNGVCYYPIYVQHFAKDQEANGILADKINILDDYTPAHTGRYGILRNNWYELSINSVTGPGYPNIPPRIPDEPVDGPADKTNKFLNVEINILNWAKHTQGVDL